ncbi:MAG: hypothetical protein K2M47_01285 [Clostridiales bacterium]|nr:hypothetical protein [Clostridiales bacterium]
MENSLKELMKDKALCEIYTDIDDTSKFAVGYIIACDSDYTIVEMYDSHGHYDGIACFLTDTIFNVATKTEYLVALTKLIDYYKEKSSYSVESVADINKILSVIKSEKRICEIELCESGNSDISGYIDTFNDDVINVCKIGDYGQNDGTAVVSRHTISFVEFDSTDTVKLEILCK